MRLLTLPELAEILGLEYRTLHSWVRRGLVTPSLRASAGSGSPNLFSVEDAVATKIIADLRDAGVGLDKLHLTAQVLRDDPTPLHRSMVILVNGKVEIYPSFELAKSAIASVSTSVIYQSDYARREIGAALQPERPLAI
jgi:DNA-binding transcriptional MerR regulator